MLASHGLVLGQIRSGIYNEWRLVSACSKLDEQCVSRLLVRGPAHVGDDHIKSLGLKFRDGVVGSQADRESNAQRLERPALINIGLWPIVNPKHVRISEATNGSRGNEPIRNSRDVFDLIHDRSRFLSLGAIPASRFGSCRR